MSNEHTEELEKMLKHYKQRKESLLIWISGHEYNHPNLEINLKDLRIASNKIVTISDRLMRLKSKSRPASMPTVAMPSIIGRYYSF